MRWSVAAFFVTAAALLAVGLWWSDWFALAGGLGAAAYAAWLLTERRP